MQVLNSGRYGLAAGSIGNCKRLLELAVERVNDRKAFGKKLGEFGMIKEKISRMVCQLYALESMTYLTTGLIDSGVGDYSLESAIAKIFGSETLWETANEALQIAGGLGYMCEYPYERIVRDSRINLIFEGTNEILRAFIALSGFQGPGKHLKEVQQAIREPIKGFGVLTDFVIHKAKMTFGRPNMDRSHSSLRHETVFFEWAAGELATATERVLRKHGRKVHLMQFAQKRFAEVVIDLYGLASVLTRTTSIIDEKGVEGAQREIAYTAGFRALIEERVRSKLGRMEREEDELLKAVADRAYVDGGYPLGIL